MTRNGISWKNVLCFAPCFVALQIDVGSWRNGIILFLTTKGEGENKVFFIGKYMPNIKQDVTLFSIFDLRRKDQYIDSTLLPYLDLIDSAAFHLPEAIILLQIPL